MGSLSTEDYNYFVNEVFGNTADTYEECFEEGLNYGWSQAKDHYTKLYKNKLKKCVPRKEWEILKKIFD